MRALFSILCLGFPQCATGWHAAARAIAGGQRLCFTLPASSIGAGEEHGRDLRVFLHPGEHVREALRRACSKPWAVRLCERAAARAKPAAAAAAAATAAAAVSTERGGVASVPPVWAAYLQHQQHLNGYHRHEVRAAIRRVARLDDARAGQQRPRLRVFSPMSCEGAMVGASLAVPSPTTPHGLGAGPGSAAARGAQNAQEEASAALQLHDALDERGAQPGWLRLPFNLLDVADDRQLAFYFNATTESKSQGGGQAAARLPELHRATRELVSDGSGPIAVLMLGGETVRVLAANAPRTTGGSADPGVARNFAKRLHRWLVPGGVLLFKRVDGQDLQQLALPRALEEAGFRVQHQQQAMEPAGANAEMDLCAFKEGKLAPDGKEYAGWEEGMSYAGGEGGRAAKNAAAAAAAAAVAAAGGKPLRVPPVAVLNLDRRVDRWKRMWRAARAAGLREEALGGATGEHRHGAQASPGVHGLMERVEATDGRRLLARIAAGGNTAEAKALRRLFSPRVHGWRYGYPDHMRQPTAATDKDSGWHANPHVGHGFRPGVLGCALSHLSLWLRLALGWNRWRGASIAELLRAHAATSCTDETNDEGAARCKLARRGSADDEAVVLILEDDAELGPGFAARWQHLSASYQLAGERQAKDTTLRPLDWDVIFLGAHESSALYADVPAATSASPAPPQGATQLLLRLANGDRSFGGGTFGYALRRSAAWLLAGAALRRGMMQAVDWFMLDQPLHMFRCEPPLVTAPDPQEEQDATAPLGTPAGSWKPYASDVHEAFPSAGLLLTWPQKPPPPPPPPQQQQQQQQQPWDGIIPFGVHVVHPLPGITVQVNATMTIRAGLRIDVAEDLARLPLVAHQHRDTRACFAIARRGGRNDAADAGKADICVELLAAAEVTVPVSPSILGTNGGTGAANKAASMVALHVQMIDGAERHLGSATVDFIIASEFDASAAATSVSIDGRVHHIPIPAAAVASHAARMSKQLCVSSGLAYGDCVALQMYLVEQGSVTLP